MDELIKLVSKKTGISEAMAKTAVETVMGFLKERLPEPLAGQIDAVVGGGAGGIGDLGNVAGALGGLFGKK